MNLHQICKYVFIPLDTNSKFKFHTYYYARFVFELKRLEIEFYDKKSLFGIYDW